MNRDYEKTERADGLTDAVLTILAIVSVAVVLCGASLAATGTSWRVRAFFSVLSVLFDLVFVYEFTAKASMAVRYPRFAEWTYPAWLLFTSSIPPFLLVSGPFLAGWVHADFASAAVRGYGIASPPLGALATITALRLLRAARPFMLDRRRNGSRPVAFSAGVALCVVLLGAIFTDALFLPSWSAAWKAEHESTLTVIAEMDIGRAQFMVESNPNIKGAVMQGLVLKRADPGLMPTDYVALSDDSVTLWFDAQPVHRARGVAELIAALAAFAAAAAYGIAIKWFQNGSYGSDCLSNPEHMLHARATPVCAAEIKGILGKPLR